MYGLVRLSRGVLGNWTLTPFSPLLNRRGKVLKPRDTLVEGTVRPRQVIPILSRTVRGDFCLQNDGRRRSYYTNERDRKVLTFSVEKQIFCLL